MHNITKHKLYGEVTEGKKNNGVTINFFGLDVTLRLISAKAICGYISSGGLNSLYSHMRCNKEMLQKRVQIPCVTEKRA
jgi:hypothetical protein